MCNTCRSVLDRLFSFTAFGIVAVALAAGPAWAQSEKKEPTTTDAKAPAKDAKDTAKDTAKEDTGKDAEDSAKDTAKDTAKTTKDSAKDTAKTTKDTAKDSAKDTAKTTKDRAQDTAKDRTKDAARSARDTARDTAKETRDTVRDTARDTRDSARETAKDVRETDRETRREVQDADRDAPELRDARNGREVRDRDVRTQRDVQDDRDTRDVRDRTEIRDRDVRDRDIRDRTEIRDDSDIRDRRDVRDEREVRDRDTVREIDRRDVRTDVRRDRRDVSRTQIENFRAESVTARDLGVTFGRASTQGLVIDDVSRTAVLANIGLRRGDVIVSIDDHRVRSERDFIHFLFDPDLRHEVVTIIVLRDGREVPIEVRPVVIIEELVMVHDDFDPLHHFGVVIDDRRPDQIYVTRVIPDSPAFIAGVRAGDVITTFRGTPVRGPREFVRVLERVEPGEVAFEVNRDRRVREFTVNWPEQRAVRRSAARPDFDVDRPAIERREERRENRIERREQRRDGAEFPVAVPVEPAPAQPARPLLPRLFR